MLVGNRPTTIYVLRLEGGHYYVGKTKDVATRMMAHSVGHGSAWTKKYKPIGVEHTATEQNVLDEDMTVKKYMLAHGVDSTRGGSYSQVELDDVQLAALRAEFRGAQDLCMRCGRSGHFAIKCAHKKDTDGRVIGPRPSIAHVANSSADEYVDLLLFDGDSAMGQSYELRDDLCGRCGRSGHAQTYCYAGRDVAGRRLR